MNTKMLFYGLILILGALRGVAHAYVGTPLLETPNPIAGESIRVALPIGECDGYFVTDNPPLITRTGQVVRVDVTTRDWLTCNFPSANWRFSAGSYETGLYQIQIYRTHIFAFSGSPPETTLATTFSVNVAAGTQPLVAVPVGGSFWTTLLVLSIGMVALSRWRRLLGVPVIILLATTMPVTNNANARAHSGQSDDSSIFLLVTSDSQSLSDDVIAYVNTGLGEAPLDALREIPPSTASYLFRNRASGRFKAFLDENPTLSRAIMERYLVLQYPEDADIDEAESALRSDHDVQAAYKAMLVTDHPHPLRNLQDPLQLSRGNNSTLLAPIQYGRIQLNVDDAWDRAGGHAVVGIIDNGLEVAHPSLRQFASGFFQGGNFMRGIDVRDWPAFNYNVDERAPQPGFPTGPCNPSGAAFQSLDVAGHGTHVAGLVAANSSVSPDAKGTCKNCGLISYKMTHNSCYLDNNGDLAIVPYFDEYDFVDAMSASTENGAQVVNMSLGIPINKPDTCAFGSFFYDYPLCVQSRWFRETGTLAVAASGNRRGSIDLPAENDEIVAVGGVTASRQIWDRYPGVGCGDSYHCGSNFTVAAGDPRQEVVAAAEDIYSTTYRNFDWNYTYFCGDSFGTPMGDGYGLCTGTSMSAPQVAGVFGVLRSINPLVLPRTPEIAPPALIGLRAVVAQTSDRAQASLPWDNKEGYGVPDAEAAVEVILGKSKGAVVRNRATPLFRMYSSIGNDYVDFVAPQTAWSLEINSLNDYAPSGTFVPTYYGHPVSTWRIWPGAGAFVLTTENSPFPEQSFVSLVPIYSILRERYWPIGCVSTGCNEANRDYTLVTTVADIELSHSDGYSLGNIQGYIYAPCGENVKESLCKPKGTESFYRACNLAIDDCATFLESERLAFEANGYLSAYPATSPKLLGYAYPVVDSDSDGLVDGFENVIGTNAANADSDGDGASDSEEFPLSEVSTSDPCISSIDFLDHCI